MITKPKNLAGVALLLSLIGCNAARHNMGKRDDLAKEAKAHRYEADLAENVDKAPNDPRISQNVFPIGKPKCNLFLCDMLYNVGIAPPLTSDGKWPITASMWTGSVSGWTKVSTQQKGDIVSNGSHCGIAVDSTYTMAAGPNKIYMDQDIKSGTIQRFNTVDT